MSDILRAAPFSDDVLPYVREFRYGTQAYEQEVGTWLCDDALDFMKNMGTKVWVYQNEADQIVGFSSLGTSKWEYPKGTKPRSPVLIIPAVGLRSEFHGHPREVERRERYSEQIMAHLIDQAVAWTPPRDLLGLYVHPENTKAISLYKRWGFVRAEHISCAPVYHGYIRRLRSV